MIGSHNSLTSYKPKHWWMKPFNFIAKCQSKTVEEQLDAGVRFFDIRIKPDSMYVWHGLMKYDVTPYHALNILNNYAKEHPKEILCYRIVVEQIKASTTNLDIENIVNLSVAINEIREQFSSLKFCGAFRKYDWLTIQEPSYRVSYKSCYSSIEGWKGFPYIPYLYAKKYNPKFLEDNKGNLDDNNCVLIMDFV